ncbi:glycosyltransferase family 4 protein [Tortispora caseinolytica NRRL Y-17796]|uniref:GDP-Man:Man(3)GlcNAc(2)-PP-Dol alpha-1,2-mannosyltransferase n=1 Tax=Tortispora caseinolytica NRRL Y-17796 TaxID=767744 RepID=A0A1E4TL33_9ASCO|nr:glycosyltransferase family 4 protein [Tortispora caseinolytica NRRL Y-17796]
MNVREPTVIDNALFYVLTLLVIAGFTAFVSHWIVNGLLKLIRHIFIIDYSRKHLFLEHLSKTVTAPVVVGFFHPYCDAGGGGERVLWVAVESTLKSFNTGVVVYTGDEASSNDILDRAELRFNVTLDRSRIELVFLRKRYLVSAERWPRFTLLGQSLGSTVLGYEAISNLPPDIFVDTMGYAFTYPLVHWLLNVPIFAYVHYPTISTDMLGALNPGLSPYKWIKSLYWRWFSWLYTFVGSYPELVVANSSWTHAHITQLWWTGHKTNHIDILYPPCFQAEPDLHLARTERPPHLVAVGQFRPEKRHEVLISEYAKFLQKGTTEGEKSKLILIGSVRPDSSDAANVERLKSMTKELSISKQVQFVLDAPWSEVQSQLSNATAGLNAMWNEHFGIVLVEYMTLGAIPIAHASGGPLQDIIVPYEGKPTGFHFATKEDKNSADYDTLADVIERVFSMPQEERQQMRLRAMKSVSRFSETEFEKAWNLRIDLLLKMHEIRKQKLEAQGYLSSGE